MNYFILSLCILFVLSFSVFSQSDSGNLKTAELFSPMNADGTHNNISAGKSCFSFIGDSIGGGTFCGKSDIYYGGFRLGDDWDIFQILGVGSRNKIRNLGAINWTDNFKIPIVEPYPKLEEGEQRNIVVDTSGKDGKPGKNADGTYTLTEDTKKAEEKLKSRYQPLEKAILRNMYVVRVVDETNDFYVLFRVDELERGKRCKISWKKIDAPEEIVDFQN